MAIQKTLIAYATIFILQAFMFTACEGDEDDSPSPDMGDEDDDDSYDDDDDSGEAGGDGDTDTDGDGDMDGDGDYDGDYDDDDDDDGAPDADVDGDGDMDTDSDGDTDGDGDTDSDSDTDTDDFDDDTDSETDEEDCDTENPVTFYLSADDSNSMAGSAVARALIEQGQIVYKGLRTYEFLNYYDFDYPAAQEGSVGVSAQMRVNGDGTYNLQIGVSSPEYSVENRRPMSLTLAIDTSTSMGWGIDGETGIDRARECCRAIAGELREGDIISLVTWKSIGVTKLDSHEVTGSDDPVLLEACDDLNAYGKTNIHAGLVTAYDLAEANFNASAINRVIFISDGGANLEYGDEELIADKAELLEGDGIYLMGVGLGDAWNYNDELMDIVTDAGKGAYIFVDSKEEAQKMFGDSFLTNMEIAARDVQVVLTLPPTFEMVSFHGEEYSEDPDEVEPQHLAANDAMIFHQVVESCDQSAVSDGDTVTVTANYLDPISKTPKSDTFNATLGELLEGSHALLLKGDAVVAYAEALKEVRDLEGEAAAAIIDDALEVVNEALTASQYSSGGTKFDADLMEIRSLLESYRTTLTVGPTDPYPGPDMNDDSMSIIPACSSCDGVGDSLDEMACAIELCSTRVLMDQSYSSPTDSSIVGTYEAVERFGDQTNDLEPLQGGSYAILASGPVSGTSHSTDVGGTSMTDPLDADGAPMFNAMEWRLHLKAPDNAEGFRIHHLFFSEEYDDFIGSDFNDKFYIFIEAGSTNGGEKTVINFSKCRDPRNYYDFICSPGMQFCNPGERYCYVAINSGLSECCWYDGCPDGPATTDISGTGFECAESSDSDSESSGSSTGWVATDWPIEPSEEFDIVFHIHDTGDGIYDSAAIIDKFVFLTEVDPGTAD